ncbi:hypothetical protein DY000_02030843 [Brassica cretica]|uniref:Uncharacterized protein n=1 Tax=Brassica cretica TaxID=69181 RepID=A0ABQ7DBI2_BRACR|nr:hypothetical protein DY000_02030843 [Brassica cretica]
MANNFEQLSDDALEPMQVDPTFESRTLRKRKEKVPKHIKRGFNEKEMDSFTKRVLRIPLDKPFEEPTACHCNHEDEYETEYSGSIDSGTPPSIDIDIHPPIDNTSRESIDNSPANETFTLPSHCYPRFDVTTQLLGDFCVGSL